MKKYIAFSVIGLIVVFVVGFYLGNRVSGSLVERLCVRVLTGRDKARDDRNVDLRRAVKQAQEGAQKWGIAIHNAYMCDSRGVCLVLTNGAKVLVQWKNMGTEATDGEKELDRKLSGLSLMLRTRNGLPLSRVDLRDDRNAGAE